MRLSRNLLYGLPNWHGPACLHNECPNLAAVIAKNTQPGSKACFAVTGIVLLTILNAASPCNKKHINLMINKEFAELSRSAEENDTASTRGDSADATLRTGENYGPDGGGATDSRRSSNRGFAAMDREKQKQIASAGGRAAHQQGVAHEWSRDEARAAGRKGGHAVSQNRNHMAEIGRKGGQNSGLRRQQGEE